MNREKETQSIIEYVDAMYSGQIICREVIISLFVLSGYVSRMFVKEVLWALDRRNTIHISQRIKCIQCKNGDEDIHRLVIKLGDNCTREKVLEKIKNLDKGDLYGSK